MQMLRRKLYLAVLRLLGRERQVFAPHGIAVQVPREADVKLRYDLARGRPYEAAEAQMIRQFLLPGMSVIELGGCLGIVSALIRNQIGPTAHHIVVEANPELARLCEPNAKIGAANGATQIVVAAVDYSGAASVSFSLGKTAHGGHVSAKGKISVPTTTLSKLAESLPPGPFALVCDIEGAELAMINQQEPELRRISLLILETHPTAYPDGAADKDRMLAKIAELGLRQIAQVKNVHAFLR